MRFSYLTHVVRDDPCHQQVEVREPFLDGLGAGLPVLAIIRPQRVEFVLRILVGLCLKFREATNLGILTVALRTLPTDKWDEWVNHGRTLWKCEAAA